MCYNFAGASVMVTVLPDAPHSCGCPNTSIGMDCSAIFDFCVIHYSFFNGNKGLKVITASKLEEALGKASNQAV
jgi:hypothetical protein